MKKCLQYDTVPDVMVKGSAGQRDTDVHAEGEMRFIGGTQMIYEIKTGQLPC